MITRHTCDVWRATATGTNGRMTKTLHAETQACNFIPMASRAEIENGFSVGSAYDVYFPSYTQDVKTGDQLKWNGDTYNVRAARAYEVPTVGHLHAMCVRENA